MNPININIPKNEAKKLNDLVKKAQTNGSKIFVQQPNSAIFFLTPANEIQQQIQKILNDKQHCWKFEYSFARNYPKCHLIELEHCFDKLHQLKDSKHDPSFLLTSHQGLDKICRVVKDDFAGCILAYLKKCGTPLHKELGTAIADAVLDHLNLVCNPTSDFRNNVVERSSCLHEKVLSQRNFQLECNNPFFTTVAWGEMKAHSKDGNSLKAKPIDYAIDAGCCAYRQWEQCAMPRIRQECAIESEDLLKNVIEKLLGGVTNFLCYQDLFQPGSQLCSEFPTLEEQQQQVNITYADHQKFSIFALIKMFLTRADS